MTKSKHKVFRFSEKEIEDLSRLAKAYGMNESEYIKCKLFDHNPDLLEENIKYIGPHLSKQAYFLAFSQIRIQQLLKEILLRQGMNLDSFNKFRQEDTQKSEEILLELGYRKIQKDLR